jgi:hypothetical protein
VIQNIINICSILGLCAWNPCFLCVSIYKLHESESLIGYFVLTDHQGLQAQAMIFLNFWKTDSLELIMTAL